MQRNIPNQKGVKDKHIFQDFFPQFDAIENIWEENTLVAPQKSRILNHLFNFIGLSYKHNSVNSCKDNIMRVEIRTSDFPLLYI